MPISAATWTLRDSSKRAAGGPTFGLENFDSEQIEIFDNRRPVMDSDFALGGKYRSIVKLFIRFAGQDGGDDRFGISTGWLVKPDVLVTAGHCAFDWSQNSGKGFGRAVEVQAYVGYQGKAGIGGPNVQFRYGNKVIMPEGWVMDDKNKQNDVAFIRLSMPFENVTPLKFEETPVSGEMLLATVGYPADKRDGNEQGARMYEELGKVSWNLGTAEGHLLNHGLILYTGQFGAPILAVEKNAVYGVNVYSKDGIGSASIIGGEWGTAYDEYLSAFNREITVSRRDDAKGIDFVQIELKSDTKNDVSEKTGFFDTLRDVTSMSEPVGSLANPFERDGGWISPTIGAVIIERRKAAEARLEKLQPKQDLSRSVNRAILAEATLQTILKEQETLIGDNKFTELMKQKYEALEPIVNKIGPVMMPSLVEPLMGLEQDKSIDTTAPNNETDSKPSLEGLKLPADINPDSFEGRLYKATKCETDDITLWNRVPQILSSAQTSVEDFPTDLSQLAQSVPPPQTSNDPDEASLTKYTTLLTKRAALGEAALQSLAEMPSDTLEDSFFSAIGSAVQKLGEGTIKYAPLI